MRSKKSSKPSSSGTESLKRFLDHHVDKYNRPAFIAPDPVSVPHQYSSRIDIEITAFWTAMLAWGQRKTIINKAIELFGLMDNAPGEFVLHHSDDDLKRLLKFRHRTFQPTDTLYFIEFFKQHYSRHDSLEIAFTGESGERAGDTGAMLAAFHDYFFAPDWAPRRTRKHVSTPASRSSCKRLNMFLRWMVRRDDRGVDFGLWKRIDPSVLMIPLDVHVHRVATSLGLLTRKQADWAATVELTEALRAFDPSDPARYDFALFGIGVLEARR